MNLNNLCMGCMREKPAQGKKCPYCGYDDSVTQNSAEMLPAWTILQGAYAVGRSLGAGGFGITYIGFDLLLEYRVAIKEFFPEDLVTRAEDGHTLVVLNDVNSESYEEETQAYLREARILAEYSKNPGIVSIKDLFY